ncbi:MAG: efflux RND transporter periplasmic adaptor subunit [Rickettsiales bacterium]
MKKPLLLLFAVAIAGVAGWFWFAGSGPAEQANPAAQQGLSLAAIKVTPRPVTYHKELPGRVVAYQISEIRPQVSGIITERMFEEGSSVEEGQQLYQIDPAPYQAAYNSALADLKKAQANVKSVKAKTNRYAELVKIEAVSKQEYDDLKASLAQAEADIAIAKAAMERAKINLDYTKVYAPISGRIGKSTVTKGALVTADQTQPLATITQLDPVYVDMTQSSADLMRLRSHAEKFESIPVTLQMDGMNNTYQETGTLQFHEVTVDRTTDSVQLRALFPNPDHVLLPGLFVRTRLKLAYDNALLVPQASAQRRPDGSLFVWVLDAEGKTAQATLTSDQTVDGYWVVSGGLQPGDIVLTEGLMTLQPGMPVTPHFATKADTEATGE